jgi:hypothetical protein
MRGAVLVALAVLGVGCRRHRWEPAPADDVLTTCRDGDDGACEQVTATYLHDRRDDDAALLQKELCDAGRLYFCPSYAFALAVGRGVPPDPVRARALFVSTCSADPVACSEYGNLFATGTGVAQDLELARLLLDLACRDGDAHACGDLQRLTTAPP